MLRTYARTGKMVAVLMSVNLDLSSVCDFYAGVSLPCPYPLVLVFLEWVVMLGRGGRATGGGCADWVHRLIKEAGIAAKMAGERGVTARSVRKVRRRCLMRFKG